MKKIMLLLFLSLYTLVSAQEEEAISPADLTQVKTFLWAQAGNDDYTLSGGLSGKLALDISYLALIQYSRSYDRGNEKNDNLRFRLFGVDKVEVGLIDSIGISIDYIDVNENISIKDSTMVAYGVIAKIDTGLIWLNIFPNVAYVTSKTKLKDGSSITSNGYQLNLFSSIYLDRKGKYMMLLPQYTNTKYTDIKKMEVEYGQPLSSDMKWWFNAKLGYTQESIEFYGIKENLNAVKTVKVGLIYYF